MGQPELQLCGTLQEFAHALGLFHAGELNKDTLRSAKLLYGGLCHAELVDTLAQHLIGTVVCAGGLFTDDFDNSVVVVAEFDLVAELATEVGGELHVSVEATDGIVEQRHEVAVGGALLVSQGDVDSVIEEGVLGVVGKSTHHVDGGNLEHHVHTTLEVEAEVNLAALALTIGVAEIDLLGSHRVKVVCLTGVAQRVQEHLCVTGVSCTLGDKFLHLFALDVVFSVLFGLALDTARHHGKRQLEQTYQCECPCQKSDKSFILHSLCIYLCFLFTLL